MKTWKEATSLIIATKCGLNFNKSYNYKLLFLKRSKKTKFSGAYVFPGGHIEPSDADYKWLDLFKQQGYSDSHFLSLNPESINRPKIFLSKKKEISREISLRIGAIRETFEESGILLCKKSYQTTASATADPYTIFSDELEFWQNKIHNDANEFYSMCKKLQCHPNLWALYEWGNWMTPTFFPPEFRHNTAFFFTCLSQIPHLKTETTEVDALLWAPPDNMMKSMRNNLLPPQQHELAEMLKHKNIDDLLKIALKKSKKGVEQYLPVRVILLDGAVLLLPGDSMYPEKVDLYNEEVIDKSNITIKQFREISTRRHRIEIFDDADNKDSLFSKL